MKVFWAIQARVGLFITENKNKFDRVWHRAFLVASLLVCDFKTKCLLVLTVPI
jgi:hypothetical protein